IYSCNYRKLSNYRHRVWDLMEDFDAFNITHVPREQNHRADALAQAASTLEPLSISGLKRFSVELVSIPSVLDNVTNLQVFDDDQHILDFISNKDVFDAQIIDENSIEDHVWEEDEILELPRNRIPKGMIELERAFDLDNMLKHKDLPKADGGQYSQVNIGQADDKKNVLLGKVCTPEELEGITQALKDYIHVIAWTYDELKTYDTSVITHTIPLKPDAKPFR
ncbi:MAG TPA: reverse transcriptase-like protein, partial [Puia sp.]|nr:reverse transcriptase-like protein [Puia sp.]